MIFLMLLFQIVLVFCQQIRDYDSIVIGNLRRRDQIPLNRYSRRWNGRDLSYRRTKDIRDDDIFDTRYETQNEEKLKEEALDDLEKLQRELNWFPLDDNGV